MGIETRSLIGRCPWIFGMTSNSDYRVDCAGARDCLSAWRTVALATGSHRAKQSGSFILPICVALLVHGEAWAPRCFAWAVHHEGRH